MTTESELEKKLVKYAKSQGFLVYKFTSPSHRGVPDRLFISPRGTHVYIEFKAPGKKLTEIQRRELLKLQDQNVRAVWTDDLHEAQWMLDHCEESAFWLNGTYPV